MSAEHFYHMAHRLHGQAVEVRDCHGECYRGVIRGVDPEWLFLEPMDDGPGPGTTGTIFGRRIIRIRLATIIALVLLSSLFFI